MPDASDLPPCRPSEAILGRLAGPGGNRLNAGELYQSRG
jgi:hypothetical protein